MRAEIFPPVYECIMELMNVPLTAESSVIKLASPCDKSSEFAKIRASPPLPALHVSGMVLVDVALMTVPALLQTVTGLKVLQLLQQDPVPTGLVPRRRTRLDVNRLMGNGAE